MLTFEMIFWYWWILAIVLLAIELLVTGFFFLWMAIGAVVTGGILFFVPTLSVEVQAVIFSVFSFVSIFIWRKYSKGSLKETDHPLLNKRGEQFIGRVFTLIEAIENGQGKIKAGDSYWKVMGDDCPMDSKVKVISVKGTVFQVEKVE